MVMLDGVQIWGIDGPSVFAPETRREFSLRDPCFLSSLLSTWPNVFISISATAPPRNILFKSASDVIESHNHGIMKTPKRLDITDDPASASPQGRRLPRYEVCEDFGRRAPFT